MYLFLYSAWKDDFFFSFFLFRLNCHNILDHSGCICGIPLFHFKSHVLGRELSNVSHTDGGNWCQSWFSPMLTHFYDVPFIAGVLDPRSKELAELLDLRLRLNRSTFLAPEYEKWCNYGTFAMLYFVNSASFSCFTKYLHVLTRVTVTSKPCSWC